MGKISITNVESLRAVYDDLVRFREELEIPIDKRAGSYYPIPKEMRVGPENVRVLLNGIRTEMGVIRRYVDGLQMGDLCKSFDISCLQKEVDKLRSELGD